MRSAASFDTTPLAEGYGAMIPNYRGSSGRGERFASYVRGGMGIYDEPDIVAMTQYAISQGYADKTQLAEEAARKVATSHICQ
jgi:dipeptidyl aminopeptidase/acylaminoacyl peptidase